MHPSARDTLETFESERLVLCVRLSRGEGVEDACRAAARGGLRVLEITLTTPGALGAMERLAGEDGLCVGGGTVLTADDVRAVADAGGRFVLSPTLVPEVLEAADSLGLLAVPGAATPAEVLAARRAGAALVKIFPAGALGGPAFLRALLGPFPDARLLPTSGPDAKSAADYLEAGAAVLGVGRDVIGGPFDLDEIEAAARSVRRAVDEACGALHDAGGSPARRPEDTGPGGGAIVEVTPIPIGTSMAQGVACAWKGGQYVAIVAPHGLVACGILDPAVCQRFDFAVAMAHGTPDAPLVTPGDLLVATVDTVSPAAEARGIATGMTGHEALERLSE